MSLKNNPISKSSKIRVVLTIGDPLGIGPVITLKALKILNNKADFTIIGSRFVLEKKAKELGIKIANEILDLDNLAKRDFSPGKINANGGRASMEYLDQALELLGKNKVDCLVTCPISKEAINQAGFRFSGHTEYLADKTKRKDLLMVLLNDKLKFSLLTRHIAIKEVSRTLTKRDIEKNILKSAECLKSLFLEKEPKLVVCGLNPHASDNGLIGKEENRIFLPAIRDLKNKSKGLVIEGPLSADVAISRAFKKDYDCVIAAYHDQALIPLKLTGAETGVNLTYGLPFVRTSPLHGTGFDIAKKPHLAKPDSLIAAIKLAIKCTLNQKRA